MFERSAKLQSRYFAAIRGDAHLKERNHTVQRLTNLHEGRAAAFSVDFAVDRCGRMVSDYNESGCGWIRRLLRTLPKGRKSDQVARIALSANRDNTPRMAFPQNLRRGSSARIPARSDQARIRAKSRTSITAKRAS